MWILRWIRRRQPKKNPTMLGISHMRPRFHWKYNDLVGGLCDFSVNFILYCSFCVSSFNQLLERKYLLIYFSVYALYYRLYIFTVTSFCCFFFTYSLAWFVCEIDRNTYTCWFRLLCYGFCNNPSTQKVLESASFMSVQTIYSEVFFLFKHNFVRNM